MTQTLSQKDLQCPEKGSGRFRNILTNGQREQKEKYEYVNFKTQRIWLREE